MDVSEPAVRTRTTVGDGAVISASGIGRRMTRCGVKRQKSALVDASISINNNINIVVVRRSSLVWMSQSSPPTPYSQPSPTQLANDRAAARAREEIARRTSLGEFGHPPDLDLRDRAWMQIFEQEVLTRQPKSYYHQVTAVWNDRGFYNDSNKVLYSGQTREQVTIPKGVKVLVLKNTPQQGTRQPNANIVYVTIGDETE
jgi:hypothetical protein